MVNRNDLMDVDIAVMNFMRDNPDAPMAKIIRAAVEAAEPLIRADERERTNTVGGHRQIRDEGRADMCTDLRAKVNALDHSDTCRSRVMNTLRGKPWPCNCLRADVLALIDGGSE